MAGIPEILLPEIAANSAHPADQFAGLLLDQLATRRNIGAYLHNTLSQNLVAASFLLARLQRSEAVAVAPDLPRLTRAIDLCVRDLRILNDALFPALTPGAESSCQDDLLAIQAYTEHLRDHAGLRVFFECTAFAEDQPHRFRPAVRNLINAALQTWAEVAIIHSDAAETTIALTRNRGGFALRFLSNQPSDPRVSAVLFSTTLLQSVRALGGTLGPLASHAHDSACIAINEISERIVNV